MPWTREHLLIALNLYCKLPFGKLNRTNPLIVDVATKMGRTSNSLAMMLCNYASLDPVLKARGIKGLKGIAKHAEAMWHEYFTHVNQLAPESEQLLHDLFTVNDNDEVDFTGRSAPCLKEAPIPAQPQGPTETLTLRRERRGQQFFRQTLLSAYGVKCCVTGIAIPRLLVASHIKPWGQFPESRLDPQNGLCLSSLYDAAFDGGLITFDSDLRLVLGRDLKHGVTHQALHDHFTKYEGQPMAMPEKLAMPSTVYLAYHREHIFCG